MDAKKFLNDILINHCNFANLCFDYFKNIVCDPNFWISNHLNCKYNDRIINRCIDNFDWNKKEYFYDGYFFYFENENVSVWVTNYPYSYGTIIPGVWKYLDTLDKNVFIYENGAFEVKNSFFNRILPRRYTRLKLHRFLTKLLGREYVKRI